MRIRHGRSFGSILWITSPPGAVSVRSCSATVANNSRPPSCQAISPYGVLRSGVPSSPPRPVIESNSVPTNAAAASGFYQGFRFAIFRLHESRGITRKRAPRDFNHVRVFFRAFARP